MKQFAMKIYEAVCEKKLIASQPFPKSFNVFVGWFSKNEVLYPFVLIEIQGKSTEHQ